MSKKKEKKEVTFEQRLKKIFNNIIALFIVSEVLAIVGAVGIGNNVVNIAAGVAIIILAIVIISKLHKSLVKEMILPLKEMEDAVAKVAEGNLDVEISYEGNNEIGSLADSLRATIGRLKLIIEDLSFGLDEFSKGNFAIESEHADEYVGSYRALMEGLLKLIGGFSKTMINIDEAAEHVSVGAGELASSSQDLAQGVADQAAVVEELLATVTEVTNQVVENTKMTDQAHDNAQKIGEQAQISKEKMAELTEAMENIKETSAEIEKIIADIEGIASQTNLLSLNAAIEAARAGEAGKGFAVVADQIRSLAESSAASAVSTKELISKSINEVQRGNEITDDTAEAMNQVIEEMDALVSAVANIRTATDKQAQSVKEIEASVEQISGVVESNSAAAEETSATSQELSAQAVTMKELVSQFSLRRE